MLPLQNTSSERGKVLIVGGSTNDTTVATNVCEIEDFNQGTSTAPNLRQITPLHNARKFVLPIILPNGKVIIFGGSSQGTTNPVYIPEMFDPENEGAGWVTLPAATVPRVYHGVALLLADGSVWTASSTVNPCQPEMRTEIYKPAYFSATRPTISGTPTVGGYGQSITIPTPNPTSISRVSLTSLSATTHHYDANVRLIWLQITSTGSSSITISAPLNANLAPPGYYMIHVLDSSLVPSTAQIIQIPGSGGGGAGDTTPPTVSSTTPANGATGVPVNTVVTIIFSEQMQSSTIIWQNISFTDASFNSVDRAVSLAADNITCTVTPIAALTAGTNYIVTVLTGVKDLAGNSMASPFSFSFTAASGTTSPAQVTGLTATTASSTQLNLAWTANASTDNVTKYNVYRSTTSGFTVNTATDIPIAQPTINSYSDTGLTASTTYYYRVAAVNTSGVIGTPSNIASATTAAGAGDTTPPTVSSTTPANGATGVPVNTVVTIIFSEQMQSSTIIWQNISFTDASFNSVDRAVSLAADNITCTVTPIAPLTAGTKYTVTALTGVKDLAGNSMASPFSFSFTAASGTTSPAQVTGLTATTASSTQLNLAWTANPPANNVTHYNIYRSTTSGFTPGAGNLINSTCNSHKFPKFRINS